MWDQKSGVLTSNHKINNKNTNKQKNNIEETKNTKENQNKVQICIKKKVIDKLLKLLGNGKFNHTSNNPPPQNKFDPTHGIF